MKFSIRYTRFLLTLITLAATLPAYAQQRACTADALKQAKALLVFHNGSADQVSVEDAVKRLPPLRNPVNPKQNFDVLEVGGAIYKANYRMRLIYAQIPGSCVLMGQEILELSSP